jgi:Xaa-Pro aminopeptidase
VSDAEIVREKLDQAIDVLNEKQVDLWITFVRETTQVRDPCLDLLLGFDLTWQSALMLSRTGERIAIVGRFDADNVARLNGYTTIIGYDQSIREPLLEHLARLDPSQVALNFSEDDPAADGLTQGMFQLLTRIVRDTGYAGRFVSAQEVVGALRGRKTPMEVTRIRSAVQETQDVFRHVSSLIRPGLSAREIARWFQDAVAKRELEMGWERDYCPVVTAGPDSPFGHAMPGDFVTQRGHLLQVDFGVRKEGFVSDLQRTWYLLAEGEVGPPVEVVAAWEAARAALEAGRAALRPGVQGWEVDRAARETLVRAGYPEFMHAFGHHVGRSSHDGATILGPHWEKYGTSVDGMVEVGNVVAIELGVRVAGRGYIGCEEDVLVTPGGAEYLSEPQLELWCV